MVNSVIKLNHKEYEIYGIDLGIDDGYGNPGTARVQFYIGGQYNNAVVLGILNEYIGNNGVELGQDEYEYTELSDSYRHVVDAAIIGFAQGLGIHFNNIVAERKNNE